MAPARVLSCETEDEPADLAADRRPAGSSGDVQRRATGSRARRVSRWGRNPLRVLRVMRTADVGPLLVGRLVRDRGRRGPDRNPLSFMWDRGAATRARADLAERPRQSDGREAFMRDVPDRAHRVRDAFGFDPGEDGRGARTSATYSGFGRRPASHGEGHGEVRQGPRCCCVEVRARSAVASRYRPRTPFLCARPGHCPRKTTGFAPRRGVAKARPSRNCAPAARAAVSLCRRGA